MDLTKTNMTRIFTFVCAVILSTCVSNPYAHARQERIDLQAREQISIQSPNYPSSYPNYADVQWLVTVPQAYQVMLHFNDFRTELKYDIVVVRDGWTSDYLRSERRASLSGNSVPPNIISRGSYLWVNFTSDRWTWYRGFRARLSAELRTIILNTEGVKILDSPNYPKAYDNNIDAIWQVVAPAGFRIRIRFTYFFTEENTDVVAVHEGWTLENSRSTWRASLSGWSILANVTSQGSYLWVRFTSDYRNRYKGFHALLSAELRAIILNAEGTEILTSPNYPEPYENNIDTIWYVRAPSGYRVLLRFSNFSTEENNDTVTVRDGWTSDYSRSTLRASLFGQSIPENMTSIGSHLWIQFKSDLINGDTGFRALLHAVIPVIILQTNETQNLTSPDFPSSYDNNIDVVWHVRAPSGYRIMVHFSEFNTEPGRDLVYFYDGKTSEYQSSGQREILSGASVSRNITTVGAYIWLRFTSDDVNYSYYTGFMALLTTVETTVIILQTNETQSLTSPNFPSSYDNNIDVEWHVRAPSGYRIMVHFSEFNTEHGGDFVYVYDGKTSEYQSSGLRETLSGASVSRNITTVGAYLWLRFTSDDTYYSYYTGFMALLTTVKTTVIILQTNETQSLTSPNFPSSYDNNIDVVWHVRAHSGYRIMVHFSEFDTESERDLVYLYDGKTSEYRSSGLRETLSGQYIPSNITTVGSYLWIRFTSDDWYSYFYDYSYTGFKAVLTTVETPVIMLDTIETEYVSIPNVPGYYDNNIDIALQVIATSGFRVHVLFRHFETEENSDFVYIYEGWTSDFSRSTLRASLSGRSIQENITSIGSYLWIRFASNEGTRFSGFQALLNVKLPVIYLNHGNAEYLQSPNYPAQYGTNLNLMWHAIAPENHQVVLHFVDFWVKTSRDFLYLYEGLTSEFEGSTLRRPNISGTYSPNDITIRGPFLWIRFTSDDGSQGGYRYTGFNISLFATPVPVPTTLTSTTNPTTTQGQPSTPASTSVIPYHAPDTTTVTAKPASSSTKVGPATKRNPRSHQPVLAISLVAVAVLVCVCVAGYIRWRKRSSSKRTPPQVSHADNNGTGNSRDSRSVNHQPPTPDILTSHHASSRRSNSYVRPETICPTPQPFLDNEYEEFDDGRKRFDGAVGGMSLPSNEPRETHISSPIPGPYNHLAANPAQGKNCEEYEAVDEAISNYDTRASLNRNDFNSPATLPDDDIETPAYFTLESRVADDEGDNFADYQEVGETSFNGPDVAESSARESQRSCLTRQCLKRSSTPVNGVSGLTKLDDEFINQYQNDEIAAQIDTVDRELGWNRLTYKQNGTGEGMDRNVTLNDEKEYDSLNFRSPSDLKSRLSKRSLQSSFGQADEETGKNVYGALDLQRSSDLSDPANDTMYNDNVYGILTEMESDVDGWEPETRKHTVGQLGPLENNGRKDRESKSKSCQDFGKKEGATQHSGHVETHGSRRQGRCVAPRTSTKTLNPAKMPGKEDTTYSADEEYEKKSNEQIPEAEGVYENQFGLQISLDEEQPIYENTGGLSSGASETEDDYANLDYRNVGKEEAYDAIDQNILETSAPEELDSIYSNYTY